MATPVVAKNKYRALKKWIACLIYQANEADKPVGQANIRKAMGRVWLSAGVPSGGTGVLSGDICVDTTNDDAYRYYDAWYKCSVEA